MKQKPVDQQRKKQMRLHRTPIDPTLWRRRFEVPLIIGAVLYLVAYSIQVTSHPGPAASRFSRASSGESGASSSWTTW